MKISVVVSTFPPYRGGMGNVAAQQAAVLAGLGHEVTVLTPASGEPRTEKRDGYSVTFVPGLFSIGNASFVPQLYAQMKGADVVFLHYPFMGGAEAVALAKYIRKDAKLVVYYHMDLVGQPPRDQLFRLYTRFFMPSILKNADRLAVSSADYAMTGALSALWSRLPARMLVEIPPAVDTDTFFPGPARPEVRERLRIDAGVPLILFVGGLDTAHYFKGLEVLLRAVTHVVRSGQPCALLVVGEGDLRQRYEEMAHNLGMVDHVRFVGNVPRQELAELYRASDVVSVPSVDRSEAFGMVYVEAMACGKPVVASRLPGVRTVVVDGETGLLVEPNNVQAVADAVGRLLAAPEEAQRMGKAGARHVASQYTLALLRQRLQKMLDDFTLSA